jgi:hypothetical protein
MAKPTDPDVFTLHRDFIWANRMRTEFDTVLGRSDEMEPARFLIESQMYMSLWYGMLYVVVEGWKDLSLEDTAIDALLDSQNISLLKRYRYGVFHFQRRYFDQRFLDLIDSGENVVEWIRNLNNELDRFFLERSRE